MGKYKGKTGGGAAAADGGDADLSGAIDGAMKESMGLDGGSISTPCSRCRC